jgi:hypothetical protein
MFNTEVLVTKERDVQWHKQNGVGASQHGVATSEHRISRFSTIPVHHTTSGTNLAHKHVKQTR